MELQNALLAKDYESAFAQAHTLKGVAGNLGFDNVLESLAPMVELLRDSENASKHVEEIERYMEQVTVSYEKILKILEMLQ